MSMPGATRTRQRPPSGTVTFLFSDIEGSTQLVRAFGDGYRDLLDRHRAALRAAFRAHGGWERGTEGDSFFVIFPSAREAVAAAIEAQRALAAAAWPPGGEIRVRMGVHSGEASVIGGDYVGLDVHRAARIASAAHGGQVVVSNTTRMLVEPDLPAGVSLRDLGSHRLKDLGEPERLHQLVIPDLRNEFPPVRSLSNVVAGLPLLLPTIIGRDQDLAAVISLVRERRLVTVTGVGGTGKTRLVQEVARAVANDFPDGAAFVSLEALRDAGLVVEEILRALRLDLASSKPPEDRLQEQLAEREILLILDNLEQLPGVSKVVGAVLEMGPGVRVLAASQAPLRLAAEREYALRPLSLEGDVRPAGDRLSPCVRLFLERASALGGEVPTEGQELEVIGAICARLDGLPLAIELAAAQARVLSPAAILDRVGRRIDALKARQEDVPERHRTITGAVRWSYDLLTASQQGLFRKLAVFRGGARITEIERMTELERVDDGALNADGQDDADVIELLDALVSRSLVGVRRRPGAADRFAMLETIRTVARELLGAVGEDVRVQDHHAEVYRELASRAEPELYRRDRRAWLGTLSEENDNLRVALDTLEATDLAAAIEMAADLWRFWQQRGHFREAVERLDRLVAAAGNDTSRVPAGTLSRGEEAAGSIKYWMRRAGNDIVARHYQRSLELARESGDPRREAWAMYNLAFAYDFVQEGGGPTDTARAMELRGAALERFRELGDRRGIAESLWAIGGNPMRITTDPATARPILDEAMTIMAELGDLYGLSWAHASLGILGTATGRFDEARKSLLRAAELFIADGDVTGPLVVVQAFGAVAAAQGDAATAVKLRTAAERVARELGGELPRIPPLVGPISAAEATLSPKELEMAVAAGRELDPAEFLAGQLAARDEPPANVAE